MQRRSWASLSRNGIQSDGVRFEFNELPRRMYRRDACSYIQVAASPQHFFAGIRQKSIIFLKRLVLCISVITAPNYEHRLLVLFGGLDCHPSAETRLGTLGATATSLAAVSVRGRASRSGRDFPVRRLRVRASIGGPLACLIEMLLASRGIRDLAASAAEAKDAPDAPHDEGGQGAGEPSGGEAA
jgi:hypothetical protein